jgi:hypothetical protein
MRPRYAGNPVRFEYQSRFGGAACFKFTKYNTDWANLIIGNTCVQFWEVRQQRLRRPHVRPNLA